MRQIYAGDWAENEIGELVAYHDISINMGKKYPILTMKKFDNIKDLKEFINGLV